MNRARAALLLAGVLLLIARPATASEGAGTGRVPVRVVVFIVDGVSFEELMAVPQISELARAGGAGLMTTSARYREDPEKVYQALGSGTGPEPQFHRLLARTLCGSAGRVSVGFSLSGSQPSRLVESEAAALAGRPCVSTSGSVRVEWVLTSEQSEAATAAGSRESVLADAGRRIAGQIRPFRGGPTLVLVVSPTGSKDMTRRGDEVTPIVMAVAADNRVPQPSGSTHALSSGTTRQSGLVAIIDVAPTILHFRADPIPSEMDGQPIEITDDPAPFELHRLHLEQRRIRLPIQLAEVAFVAAGGLVAIVALLVQARRRSLSPRVAGAMRFLALCVASLPIPLLLGGLLPRLTYWTVVSFLVISIVGLAALARATRWPGPMAPFTFLGAIGLLAILVDALLGWRGARIPLVGGTMFDGARFYGVPNSLLFIPLAGALFVAAALQPFTGFLLLVGTGVFVGFPFLGADVGGALTIFFAAGLWWVLRTRRRIGPRDLTFVAGTSAVGLGAVLLANRYLPGTPTHATAFVERTGRSVGDALSELGSRLGVGFDQIRDVPAALIPLVGLLVVLALVVNRWGPVGSGLARVGERWRHALIVLCLSGVVAYFANDTGVAAAAPVFLYAMSGMAYAAFLTAEAADDTPAGTRVTATVGGT